MCWALWHLGMLDRAFTWQVKSGKAGQGDPKASLSPKKQPPCSSVQARVCPGDVGALPMRKSSRVPQLGSAQASGMVVGTVVVTVMRGFNFIIIF